MPNTIPRGEIRRRGRCTDRLKPKRCKNFLQLRMGMGNQEYCCFGDVDDYCG
jgi:hypothetical protein